MKRTNLIAVLLGFAPVGAVSQDAFARGRMYNPATGTFMQRDPAGMPLAPPMGRNLSGSKYTQRDPTAQYADGMNLYQYVRSSPCVWIDPFGEKAGRITIQDAVWAITSSLHKYQGHVVEDKCKEICPEHLLAIYIRESKLDPEAYLKKFDRNPPNAPTDLSEYRGAAGLGGILRSAADEIRRIADRRLSGYAPPTNPASNTGADSFVTGGTRTNVGTTRVPRYTYTNVDARRARWDVQANSDMSVLILIDKVASAGSLDDGIKSYGTNTDAYKRSILVGAKDIHDSASCKGTCCTGPEIQTWALRLQDDEPLWFDRLYGIVMGTK